MTTSSHKLVDPILALPRVAKRLVALSVDVGLCVLTVWFAYYLRLGEFVPLSENAQWSVIASIGIAIPIFIISGLYRAIFRYNGWPALLTIAQAIGIYGVIYSAIFTAIGIPGVPRTVGIIQPILLLLFVGSSRALARRWLGKRYQTMLKLAARPRIFIYGAGDTGRQLAAAITNSPEMQVAGFLDDDSRLHGHVLNGLTIYKPTDLERLVERLNIDTVLLAMPSLARKRRNEILGAIRMARVAVRTLPSVTDLAQGKVGADNLQELDIDDLLGREPVTPDDQLMSKKIHDRVVMVTGAGGSIGSELCRQILPFKPRKLLLIELNEFSLYAIHQELEQKFNGATEIIPLLASVQDLARMKDIMSTWRPDTLYHAAAYKHVPLVEHNPVEGIKNNVFGTLRTALAAIECQVSDFVLISTDKAVRPTNTMGASKRLAEMTLQSFAERHATTTFSMVRFGNVLGSSGSVVPKFRQQIRDGGPITLTDAEITRYFMTIPEASQLVIQAAAMAEGGEVYVLDMGEAVKIIDLAHRMIELAGCSIKDGQNPNGDIEVAITGLRPGEKLYEELLIGNNPQPTSHTRIMKAHEEFMSWSDLQIKLAELEKALVANDVRSIRSIMENLVSGYCPSEKIVDWMHLEKAGAAPNSSPAQD